MSALVSLFIFFGILLGVHVLTRTPCTGLETDLRFTNTIKGLAMLMILYHHSGIYHSKLFWFFYGSGWGFCGVSLFFFISGFGLVKSQLKTDPSTWKFIKKRWLALGPTIILCMVARWMLDPLMTLKISFPVDPMVLVGAKEWFLLALFAWYLIFIFVVKRFPKTDILFILMMVALILWALLDIVSENSPMAGLWMRFPFSFVLGVAFGYHTTAVMDYLKHRLVLSLCLSLVAIVLACHLKNNTYLVYPMLDLAILPMCLSLAILIYRLDINSELIQFLGKLSLPIYLIQVPMIKYGIFMGQWQNNIIGLLVTWALIFLVSIAITQIRFLIDRLVKQVVISE